MESRLEFNPIASGCLPDSIPPVGASPQVSPISRYNVTVTAQNFGLLRDLITTPHLWDSTVHEAINFLGVKETMYVAVVRS